MKTREDNSITLGGKRKSRKNKKKQEKTRKNKKKQEKTSQCVNDRDKKDYDQMLNTLNWNPKQ